MKPGSRRLENARASQNGQQPGRFVVNDLASALALCTDGFGIAQFLELVIDDVLRSKALVELFPDRAEERFPVYMLYPSRHLPPAKVRAFADFLIASTR